MNSEIKITVAVEDTKYEKLKPIYSERDKSSKKLTQIAKPTKAY